MPENLTRYAFAEQLNTKFTIHFAPENPVESELVEVTELLERFPQETFSILFLAPIEKVYEQQIYKIEHAEIGIFELFLVPIKKDEKGVKYESVFNRLVA